MFCFQTKMAFHSKWYFCIQIIELQNGRHTFPIFIQFELTYGPICSTAFPSESHKNVKIIGISIDEKDPNIQ